jgi:vitamin B12 transporter
MCCGSWPSVPNDICFVECALRRRKEYVMKKFVCVSLCAVAAAMPGAAQQAVTGMFPGEDETAIAVGVSRIEPIEVIGLRPSDASTAAASVTRLDENALAVRGAPNVADALRAVPGVAVSRSGGVGALTQVRIRGAEANHTLVLYDGIDVSDPVNGETDFGLLTALPVSQMDVLRGSASSVHGSDAIGGVVDLRASAGPGAVARAEAGSFETGQLTLGGQTGSFGAVMSVFGTDGVDTSGSGGETDGSSAGSVLLRGRGEVSRWTVSGLALARRTETQSDPDADFDGRIEDGDRLGKAEQVLIGGALEGEALGLDHRLRASWNQVKRENSADGQFTDDSAGERLKVGWSPSFAWQDSKLHGLIETQRETYQREDAIYGGFTDADETLDTTSIAAEYVRDGGGLHLSASVRQDFNDGQFDDALSWRAGASYQFTPLDAQLRASLGTGYKKPAFTELYGFFPGSFVGNPDLKAETSFSGELGWDQYLFSKAVHVSLTGFAARLEDEIFTAFNPDFTATALNRDGESERKGIEFAATWKATEALQVWSQATWVASENENGEDEIRVPDVTASVSAAWQKRESGLRIGGALDYVGAQDDFDFGAFPAVRVELDAYVLASLAAELPLNERAVLTLRGDNLLDEDARDVFGFAAPGAGVYLGLKLR